MVEVRLLTEKEIFNNEAKLIYFLHMVMSENLDYEVTKEMCEKYYRDIKNFIRDGSAILIGAFEGKNLIGFHWGYEKNTPGGKRIHSYFNAIEPEYRGQGIGKKFWTVLEGEAVKRKVYTIEAMCTYANKVAVNYHLHHGFQIERVQVVKKLEMGVDDSI